MYPFFPHVGNHAGLETTLRAKGYQARISRTALCSTNQNGCRTQSELQDAGVEMKSDQKSRHHLAAVMK